MSALSELAYCAGWMAGLEHALWHAVINGPYQYGRLQITTTHIRQLENLRDTCNGWILFDADAEETFVPLQLWLKQNPAVF